MTIKVLHNREFCSNLFLQKEKCTKFAELFLCQVDVSSVLSEHHILKRKNKTIIFCLHKKDGVLTIREFYEKKN